MHAYFGEVDLNSLILPVVNDYPGKLNKVGRQAFIDTIKSIRANGLEKPIIVREDKILLGGARVRAVKCLGYETIKAIVFSHSPKPNLHKIKSYDELLKISGLARLVVTDTFLMDIRHDK